MDLPSRLATALKRLPYAYLLAATYISGFAVANLQLARWTPPQYDLVRGRYLAAGLLFGVTAALPGLVAPACFEAAFGALLSLGATRKAPVISTPTSRYLKSILWSIVVALLVTWLIPTAWRQLVWFLTYGTADPGPFYWVTFFAGTTATLAVTPLLDALSEHVRTGIRSLAGMTAFGAALYSLWLFGMSIYPAITPQLGGGAAPWGFITLTTGPLPNYADAGIPKGFALDSAEMFAVIIESRADDIVFGTCLRKVAPQFEVVVVPKSRVSSYRTLGYAMSLVWPWSEADEFCAVRKSGR